MEKALVLVTVTVVVRVKDTVMGQGYSWDTRFAVWVW